MRSSRQSKTLVGLAFSAFVACSQPSEKPADTQTWQLPHDIHSFAQPDNARVTNVSLDLTPDFSAHQLRGTARLAIERGQNADSIALDTRDLTIKSVKDSHGGALGYKVGATDKPIGAPLAIALPQQGDTIAIEYETSPGAAAVQWLAPEQTSGGKVPFLFTQGEAILTRSWVPTQDSPGIRQTYDATIHVPVGMRAVMSAEHFGTDAEKDAQGLATYRFRLDKPVPPYLLALAVGDIAFRPIGKNTGVYAEPAVVDKAASEFAEVDEMIAAAEKLYGPYRWGRYDILVLPPSFPFGGMENPRLTFATPTVLRVLGRQDMDAAVKDAGGPQSPATRLHLDLTGKDPDEATSNIAYEKGAAFLQTVESVVGRQRLDAFLRDYFAHFAFQPMSTDRMLVYMKEKLLTPAEAERINVQAWIYQPGVPPNIPAVHSDAFAAVDSQVSTWKNGAAASTLNTPKWTTHEWVHFLRALPDTVPANRLADLDNTFRLSPSGNSEILFAWLEIAIRNGHQPAFAALERFLTSQGRRKFVRPLYAELAKSDWGRAMAMNIYRRARPTYHSVTSTSMDQILNWPAARPPPANR